MMGNALLHTCSEVTFNETHLLMALLTNELTRNTRQAVTVFCLMRIAEHILDLFIL